METTPIRCMCCGVTFMHPSIYLHPSHRCVAPPPARPGTTAAPTATGAVVVPLFRGRP